MDSHACNLMWDLPTTQSLFVFVFVIVIVIA